MSLGEETRALIQALVDAGVEFIIVGGAAAVMQAAPIATFDLDVVHRRTDDNVDRLLRWLLAHGAYHRFDLADPRLPPTRELLLGRGHLNFQTDLGKSDVLCELGAEEGYEQLLSDAVEMELGDLRVHVLGLPRLIAVKASTGRAKDRMALPLLIAALDEQRRAKSRI